MQTFVITGTQLQLHSPSVRSLFLPNRVSKMIRRTQSEPRLKSSQAPNPRNFKGGGSYTSRDASESRAQSAASVRQNKTIGSVPPRCNISLNNNNNKKARNHSSTQRRSKSAAEIDTDRFHHRGANKDRHSWCGNTPILEVRFATPPVPEETDADAEEADAAGRGADYAERNRAVWEGWLFRHMGEEMRMYIEERFSEEVLNSEGGGVNHLGEPTSRRLFKIYDRDPTDPRVAAEV